MSNPAGLFYVIQQVSLWALCAYVHVSLLTSVTKVSMHLTNFISITLNPALQQVL